MFKTRKSLATTKGKDTSHRAKPLVAGAYCLTIKYY